MYDQDTESGSRVPDDEQIMNRKRLRSMVIVSIVGRRDTS